MSQTDPEVSQKRLETGLKWGVGLAGVIVLGFALPYIVGGAVALVIGGVGWTALQLWPVYARKISNLKYKMIATEARKNPVETNRRIYGANQQVLAAKEEGIKRFAGALANVGDTIASLRKRFGEDEQVTKLVSAEEKMQAKLERLKTKQARARKAQALFAAEMEKAEAIWEATLEMIKVQQLGGDAEEQALAQFESQTAFKSINAEFNAAVADIDEESDDEGNFVIEAEVVKHRQIDSARELPTLPHGAVTREPAPFERESSAFPRERTKERN